MNPRYDGPERRVPESAFQTMLKHKFCIACRKSSRDTQIRTMSRTYVSPAAYLAMVLGPLIALILIAIMKTRHKLELPFCEACWQKKRMAYLFEMGSAAAFIASLILGVMAMIKLNNGYAFFVPVALAVAVMIAVQRYKQTCTPKFRKTDRQQVVVDAAQYGDLVFSRTTVATLNPPL
jgi:hypothetical protein